MKRSRFSDEQIAYALRQVGGGMLSRDGSTPGDKDFAAGLTGPGRTLPSASRDWSARAKLALQLQCCGYGRESFIQRPKRKLGQPR